MPYIKLKVYGQTVLLDGEAWPEWGAWPDWPPGSASARFSTGMGGCLLAGKPTWYVTSHPLGQLNLPFLRVW